jgi:flagellar protein FlaF
VTMAKNEKLDAYKTHQHKGESDREIEARALLNCAGQLATASQSGEDKTFYTEAIKRNQRLWTMFQVALCDPSNPLPHELKTVLLNLSCYVDKVSFRAIAEYRPALLTNLIDINRSIATGLSKKPGTADPAPAIPGEPPSATSVMTTA